MLFVYCELVFGIMRKPAIIVITGVLIFAASLIIMVIGFQIGVYPINGDDSAWDYLPILIMLVGSGLFFAGLCYNYWEYKKGRVRSHWGKDWEFGV